jgi:hypothetical protein
MPRPANIYGLVQQVQRIERIGTDALGFYHPARKPAYGANVPATHRTIQITGCGIEPPRRERAVGNSRQNRDQPIAATQGHGRESGKVADRD